MKARGLTNTGITHLPARRNGLLTPRADRPRLCTQRGEESRHESASSARNNGDAGARDASRFRLLPGSRRIGSAQRSLSIVDSQGGLCAEFCFKRRKQAPGGPHSTGVAAFAGRSTPSIAPAGAPADANDGNERCRRLSLATWPHDCVGSGNSGRLCSRHSEFCSDREPRQDGIRTGQLPKWIPQTRAPGQVQIHHHPISPEVDRVDGTPV